MDRWKINTPTEVITGSGSRKKLAEFLKDNNIKRVFVVIDPNVKKTTAGKDIIKLLKPFKTKLFYQFSTNPTFDNVSNGLMAAKDNKYDCIIAIGGGSAIDLTKAIGLLLSNGSRLENYFEGKKIKNKLPYFISIPTTCGTGSESSPYAVITDPSAPKKRGIECIYFLPSLVILDPDLLLSLDKSIIAASGLDALAHILESHISKKSTILTKIVSRGLLYSIRKNLEKAVFVKNKTALFNLQIIAFTSRLLYPRTGLTIAHALSHPLGAHTNMHHGMAVSILLKQSLIFNQKYCKSNLEDAMIAMKFKNNNAFFTWLENILVKSDIKNTIEKQLSNKDIDLINIAAESLNSSNIKSNPRPINKKQATDIIRKSLEDVYAK